MSTRLFILLLFALSFVGCTNEEWEKAFYIVTLSVTFIPIVGNIAAVICDKSGKPAWASWIRRMIPFAVSFAQAKTPAQRLQSITGAVEAVAKDKGWDVDHPDTNVADLMKKLNEAKKPSVDPDPPAKPIEVTPAQLPSPTEEVTPVMPPKDGVL